MDSSTENILKRINDLEHKIMMVNRDVQELKDSVRKDYSVGFIPQNSPEFPRREFYRNY